MAITIMRTSDRLKVKIDDITLIVSSLTYHQKIEVQSCGLASIGNKSPSDTPQIDVNRMMRLCLKFCIKGIDGINTLDGDKYTLDFEDDKKTKLSDECVEELLSMPITSQKIIVTLMALMAGLPKNGEIIDPETNKKLQGVEILLKKSKGEKATKKTKRSK